MELREYLNFHEMVKELHINEKESIFDKNPDYLIVDAKAKNSYIVTKWTHGKSPRDIYTVTKAGNKWSCDCPTKTTYCKHIDMVKEYLKNGKQSEWNVDMSDLKAKLNAKGVKV